MTPPATKPLDAPLWSVCINQDWLPFIAGALKQLSLQATWKVPDDNALLDVQGRVFDLISLFEQVSAGCASSVPDHMCLSGNFTDQPFNWLNTGGFTSTWNSGQGWHSNNPSGDLVDQVGIHRLWSPTLIESYSFTFNSPSFPRSGHGTVDFLLAGAVIRTDTYSQPVGTTFTMSNSTPITCDGIRINWAYDRASGVIQQVNCQNWSICYKGIFPLYVAPNPSFTHVFDFSTGLQQGWSVAAGHGSFTGSGWLSSYNGADNILRVQRAIPSTLTVTGLECVYSVNNCAGGTSSLLRLLNGTTISFNDTVLDGQSVSNRDVSFSANNSGKTNLLFAVDAHGHNTGFLSRVAISGVGFDPF